MKPAGPEVCETCPAHNPENLIKLGVDMNNWDFIVALCGNPNTGKSTVFNGKMGIWRVSRAIVHSS